MKKTLLLGGALAIMLLLLSGCSTPEPTEPEATPTEVPTQAPPTYVAPTPEPTITPRPMQDVEWPAADATLLEIDPYDKPTPAPLAFGEYREYESAKLRAAFKVPIYLGDPVGEQDDTTTYIEFSEPLTDIRSAVEGGQAIFTLGAVVTGTTQTTADAENMLDSMIDELRQKYDDVRVSDKAGNRMLSTTGRYVTIWVERPLNDQEGAPTVSMRGRCLVVPVDKKLYSIMYLCPAQFNGDYENIYREIRESFREL